MQAVVEKLVQAIGSRDSAGVHAVVRPDTRLRALIPPGPVESNGSDEIAERFGGWLGWLASVELASSSVEEIAGRWRFSYRLRVRDEDGGTMLLEQQGFCDVDGEHITGIDLVCSGFRPIDAA